MNFIAYLFSLPYMRWHIIFVFIPSFLMWIFFGKYLIHYKKTFLFVTFFSFLWGFVFDLVASPITGLWYFNKQLNLGISFLGLPLEEYLFLLFVPQGVTGLFLILRKKKVI